MNASQMAERGAAFRTFEFSFPALDTLIRVEAWAGRTIIRSSRDTFSTVRKLSFIRELVAEGFIDGACVEAGAVKRLRWIVDPQLGERRDRALANRFMVRSLCGVSLLWSVLMLLMFLGLL